MHMRVGRQAPAGADACRATAGAAACSSSSRARDARARGEARLQLQHALIGGQPRAHPRQQQQQQQQARRRVGCAAAGSKAASDAGPKEAHKIFDEVVITVKSGDGGHGEIVESGAGKFVKNNKYRPGGNQPKKIWLPASDPADGADGADVMLVCDPSVDSLLHLHERKSYAAAKGSHGNPAAGSAGPKRNEGTRKAATAPMLIPVPPGTVVKKKGSGAVVGELLQPGQRLLVAKGGKGGSGVRAPSREQRKGELAREIKYARESGAEVVQVVDSNWQHDARGLPGQQLSLQLLLRVVADVGIVGFPNAGKSSLLAALTRASPAVAPYPFTTLMPNLGVMAAGQGPVLADLPGLIEGAHQGRGLGRMFLRHLRRTRALLHVVDASAADPATDYLAVREELRMYNPDYCTRPHVVALNKMDLEDAGALRAEVAAEVEAAARRLAAEHGAEAMPPPAAVVPVSAATGEGLAALAGALAGALGGGGAGGGGGGGDPFEEEWAPAERRRGGGGGSTEAWDGAAAGAGEAGEEEEGEGEEEDGWDEETEAAAERWQAILEERLAAEAAPAAARPLPAEQQHGPQRRRGEESAEEEGGAGGGGGDAGDEVAPADDEDLWLLELSEDELLKLEVE